MTSSSHWAGSVFSMDDSETNLISLRSNREKEVTNHQGFPKVLACLFVSCVLAEVVFSAKASGGDTVSVGETRLFMITGRGNRVEVTSIERLSPTKLYVLGAIHVQKGADLSLEVYNQSGLKAHRDEGGMVETSIRFSQAKSFGRRW